MNLELGLVIDIDGVLVDGKEEIGRSSSAIKLLREHRIPFVLLTNNTAPSEQDKADALNSIFGQDLITADQVILNYTPLKKEIEAIKNNVLLIGREEQSIAARLGLISYVTCQEVLDMFPFLSPKSATLMSQEDAKKTVRQRLGLLEVEQPRDLQIKAMLIINVPHNWDAKLNVALSFFYNQNLKQWQSQEELNLQVVCIIRDTHLIYHGYPVLMVGSFATVLKKLVHQKTGKPLQIKYYGKPQKIVFEYAHNRLESIAGTCLKRTVMIGDNPETDIKGAVDYGWESCLVMTGVSKKPPYFAQPTFVAMNILAGIERLLGL